MTRGFTSLLRLAARSRRRRRCSQEASFPPPFSFRRHLFCKSTPATSAAARETADNVENNNSSNDDGKSSSTTPRHSLQRHRSGGHSSNDNDKSSSDRHTTPTAPRPCSSRVGLGALPERKPARPHVVVALSGGVDSSVAALLLRERRQHFAELACVHARVWDGDDEERGAGGGEGGDGDGDGTTPSCSAAADAADAAAVARCLGLPMLKRSHSTALDPRSSSFDAVSSYWCDVFEPFCRGYARGLTPNPDLECNAAVKFGALLEACEREGGDVLATGHYSRLRWRSGSGSGVGSGVRGFAPSAASALGWLVDDDVENRRPSPSCPSFPQLLRAVDRARDQSYFLASVPGEALARAAFPVGAMTKEQVRETAVAAASSDAKLAPLLAANSRRSSAGICFVGRRRSFGGFMRQYVEPVSGAFVDVERAWKEEKRRKKDDGGSGGGGDNVEASPSPPPPPTIAPCPDVLALTHGQRAKIPGLDAPFYVASKDLRERKRVLVAKGDRNHRALFCREAALADERWISGRSPFDETKVPRAVRLEYKARYRQPPRKLTVERASASLVTDSSRRRFVPSALFSLLPPPAFQSSPSSPSARSSLLESPSTLVARFDLPARAVTPGQAVVFYDGEVCLGTATVVAPGRSLLELGEREVEGAAVAAAEGEASAAWEG